MTHCIVVDTNVLAIAAELHAEASEDCVLACVSLLRRIERGQRLAADTTGHIFDEYFKVLDRPRTSTIASKLVRRLYDRRHFEDVCHLVEITPSDDPPGSFQEVPEGLRDFDNDDHKFLAVAVAEGGRPPIFTGLDRKWWDRKTDFTDAGLLVQFPCASDLM